MRIAKAISHAFLIVVLVVVVVVLMAIIPTLLALLALEGLWVPFGVLVFFILVVLAIVIDSHEPDRA